MKMLTVDSPPAIDDQNAEVAPVHCCQTDAEIAKRLQEMREQQDPWLKSLESCTVVRAT